MDLDMAASGGAGAAAGAAGAAGAKFAKGGAGNFVVHPSGPSFCF